MKSDDIHISREVEGGESVFVLWMNTRVPSQFLFWLTVISLVPVIYAGVCAPCELYNMRGHVVITVFAIRLLFLLIYEVFMVAMVCVLLLHLFGRREIRIGKRFGTTFIGIGRLGVARRFEIEDGAYLTTRRWKDYRGNNRYDLILHSQGEKEIRLYRAYFTIGSLGDTNLLREILCENTSLKDGRGKTKVSVAFAAGNSHKEHKGRKERNDKMKFIKRILALFCCCVCFVCMSSMVAEKATFNAIDYILSPYISFTRGIIGSQEHMGNVLLGLGLMLVGVFVYCAVAVIVMQLFMVLFKVLLSLWKKHHPVNPVNPVKETQIERNAP